MLFTYNRRGWHGQDGASACEEKDRRAASRATARRQEASVGHRKEPWHDSRLVHRVTLTSIAAAATAPHYSPFYNHIRIYIIIKLPVLF